MASITCKECGDEFGFISATHLRAAHDMSTEQYKEKYPEANFQTEENKKKIAVAKKGDKNPMRRDEVKKKRSETLKRLFADGEIQPASTNPQVAEKISEALQGRSRSEETKEKVAETLKGRYAGPDNPNWKGRIQKECEFCETTFKVTPAFSDQIFCSMNCKGKWQSENLTGKNNPSWKGGYLRYYGPNWYIQRRKARKRDNYACRSCGITEEELGRQLDVHHIVPFREFGLARYVEANQLLNLVSYCTACHGRKEPAEVLPDEVPMRIASKQLITPPIAKRVVAQ